MPLIDTFAVLLAVGFGAVVVVGIVVRLMRGRA